MYTRARARTHTHIQTGHYAAPLGRSRFDDHNDSLCSTEDVPRYGSRFSSSRFVGIAQLCEISERGARNRVNYTANNWSRGRWIELVLPRGRGIETNDYWMTERDRHQGSRWLVSWNHRCTRQLRVFVFVTMRGLWRSTFTMCDYICARWTLTIRSFDIVVDCEIMGVKNNVV